MFPRAAYRKSCLRMLVRSGALLAVLVIWVGTQRCTLGQSCGYYVQTKSERQAAQLRNTDLSFKALLSSENAFHNQTGHSQTGHSQTGHSQTGHSQTGHSQMGHSQMGPKAHPLESTSDNKPHHCEGPACRQQPTLPPITFQVPLPEPSRLQVQGILSNSVCYPESDSLWANEEVLPEAKDVPRDLFRPPRKSLASNA